MAKLFDVVEAVLILAMLAWFYAVFALDPFQLRDDGFGGAALLFLAFQVPAITTFMLWHRWRRQHETRQRA
jgi:membrane protein implicated in regulation of membrane protease activity